MDDISVKGYAKVNLSLDILSKMPDGYHEMKMIMQTVSLCDDIKISCRSGEGNIRVTTNRAYLPGGEKNIAGKAARAIL